MAYHVLTVTKRGYLKTLKGEVIEDVCHPPRKHLKIEARMTPINVDKSVDAANQDCEKLRYYFNYVQPELTSAEREYVSRLHFFDREPLRTVEELTKELAMANEILRALLPCERQVKRKVFL